MDMFSKLTQLARHENSAVVTCLMLSEQGVDKQKAFKPLQKL